MTESASCFGAHLVGSIPAKTAEEAFRLAVENMGACLKRIPDGEVGERGTWIRWQYAKIGSSPQLEPVDVENTYVPMPPLAIVNGVTSADKIELTNLGYADAAIESYVVFERLCQEGVIPQDVRFQVGLPTPFSVSLFYLEQESRVIFEQAYERALGHELARMLESIPADNFAIQWETVGEFGFLEGLMDYHIEGDPVDAITDRVARLVESVPEPADVGIHLCYGDSGHKHFCEPKDAGFLAKVAAGTMSKASRPIAWIHMPVPKERGDAGYFSPLADLDLPRSTDLYLGLVHQTGGEEGTRRRIEAASAAIGRFGVATECGLGRRDPETIPALMRQHANVIERV